MHASPYYWQGKHKATNFFSTVPYGLTTNELNAWMEFGGGQQLWDELYEQFNLKGFHGGSTGVQMGGWFNKEITTVADLNGLKIRIPGLGRDALRKPRAPTTRPPGAGRLAAPHAGPNH